MEKDAKIYVAGHRGMVGSAICRALERNGYTNIITRTHKELDLCRQDAVEEFFAKEKPDYVFLAAAKVGGIMANSEALADFMYENMILEMNVIHAAWQSSCKKLMFLGSSCIYPRMAPQPVSEERKRELKGKGFKILDAAFKPDDFENDEFDETEALEKFKVQG
jgi:GDP-L-fucose synthase